MARRSQCSSAGDNPLDPNYLPPHYREDYRLAIDALVEEDLEGYYQFLQKADVVDFLSTPEIHFIQSCVQPPHQSGHPEQRFLDDDGDGSSDTYWPIHSDLDVPGLDLGWPQVNPFMGPTEVTTLINPPEPDMPSIKDQARRLIKNAQQVIAIVMDMFTDVDIFADILNAASRNVAVYILLDEQNAHHFLQMVSNCRVNLANFEFLRVRTVSGITYQCRSGKSFKGQMLDRFLLTDCRAVLSGNYSYMWSFEKLHRCMAHLFLGQFVTTFDEEFRILFAQSQPMVIENLLARMEDFNAPQKREHLDEKAMLYRDPRKFLLMDAIQPDEWQRHSYDDRLEGDWRMVALKKQGSLRGPGDMYGRFAAQQTHMDPGFDQGSLRIPRGENPAYKRHSYAEGGHDRFSVPFLQQQRMADFEPQGKHLPRGHHPGPEGNYGGYEKFWNQDFQSADQYCDPALPPEIQQSDNFDPVLNYLRKADFDQSSEKGFLAPDMPIPSSHLRRPSLGHPNVGQTSPTPSSSADPKLFLQEPPGDRKDPAVKRGLRNWRINSFLNAYDAAGDEGLPQVPMQGPDAFEDPVLCAQASAPAATQPVFKIPNVREFKVPAVPRPSQIPNYGKALEPPRKVSTEPPAVAAEFKTSPTPSESSSSTREEEKVQAVEPKEPRSSLLRREDSFSRKYNAGLLRSSRLRSSLIFSSLEQQPAEETASSDQQHEQSDKAEAEQPKLSFVSKVLGSRRTREPFEWNRYIKSSTFDNSSSETSKADEARCKPDDQKSSKEEDSKDPVANPEALKPLKLSDSKPDNQPKPAGVEPLEAEKQVQPPKPSLKKPLMLGSLDMNDPDNRLMYFKELAAQRKAAEAEKKKKKEAETKLPGDNESTPVAQKDELSPKVSSSEIVLTSDGRSIKRETAVGTSPIAETHSPTSAPHLDAGGKTSESDSRHEAETKVSVEAEMAGSLANLPTSVGAEFNQMKSLQESSSPCVTGSGSLPTSTSCSNAYQYLPDINKTQPTPAETVSRETSLVPAGLEESLSSLGVDTQIKSFESPRSETNIWTPEPQTNPDKDAPIYLIPTPTGLKDVSSSRGETLSCSFTADPPFAHTFDVLCPKMDKHEAEESRESLLSDRSSLSVLQNPESSSEPSKSDSFGPTSLSSTFSQSFAASAKTNVESTAEPAESLTALQKETQTPGADSSPFHSPHTTADVSAVPKSPEEFISGSTSPYPASYLPDTSLPSESSLDTTVHHSDLRDTITSVNAPADTAVNLLPSESTLSTFPTPEDTSEEPSDLNLTEAGQTSSLCEDHKSVLTPPEENPENVSLSVTLPSDSLSLKSKELSSYLQTELQSGPGEPTSKSLAEVHLPCKAPEESPESCRAEPLAPAESFPAESESAETGENKSKDVEEVEKTVESCTEEPEKPEDSAKQVNCSETTDASHKQLKSSPSRYSSSTANVVSSSNLRDDTKLLLEQISANCQSRNQANKESPVTDDEKEEEVDKQAKKEKGLNRGHNRGQAKSPQEREKLLERIQSFRKERKVYSRFEMAP